MYSVYKYVFQSKPSEVTENLSKIPEKCLWEISLFSKMAGCRPATLLKLKFFKGIFSTVTSSGLLEIGRTAIHRKSNNYRKLERRALNNFSEISYLWVFKFFRKQTLKSIAWK